MAEAKRIAIASLISTAITLLLTLTFTGAFGQIKKINNSASKEEVECVKIDMVAYTDTKVLKLEKDTKEYVDKSVLALDSKTNVQLNQILENQKMILKHIIGED